MGKTLIVADYGQLELRLLAHMANCKSMLTAFELGGDFHSRTALGMYDYIQEAVARNEVLLEWDYPNVRREGSPPVISRFTLRISVLPRLSLPPFAPRLPPPRRSFALVRCLFPSPTASP